MEAKEIEVKNQNNITDAVYGLDIFMKNWCMDVVETEKLGEPVFRCHECEFLKGKCKCLVKTFATEHAHSYPMQHFGSMCGIEGEDMNKSILVIDTPKACINCPCHHRDNIMERNKEWCYAEMRKLDENKIEVSKPEWCPLKDAPREILPSEEKIWFGEQYAQGWNSCIDKILKRIER